VGNIHGEHSLASPYDSWGTFMGNIPKFHRRTRLPLRESPSLTTQSKVAPFRQPLLLFMQPGSHSVKGSSPNKCNRVQYTVPNTRNLGFILFILFFLLFIFIFFLEYSFERCHSRVAQRLNQRTFYFFGVSLVCKSEPGEKHN
jgi:hypothetical protein